MSATGTNAVQLGATAQPGRPGSAAAPRARAAALPLLRYFALALGPIAWLGLLLLVLAAVCGLALRPALERTNAAQATEIAALRAQRDRLRDPALALAARDPLAPLVTALPPASAVADFLAQLQARAQSGSVQIDRTEYRVQTLVHNSVLRYRLSFPAHVDYPHLRHWLEALLHDYPSVALDELTLRREVDGGEELEARLGLSFFVRAEAP